MGAFQELIQSDKPVLVDFYADWCGPCKVMAPVIQEVAKAVEGKARVVKVNVDKNTEAAQIYGISGIPTFIVFKNGNILWRHSGTIDKKSLMNVLSQHAYLFYKIFVVDTCYVFPVMFRKMLNKVPFPISLNT